MPIFKKWMKKLGASTAWLCILMMHVATAQAQTANVSAHMPAGTDWQVVSSDADVDQAFARARAARLPVFLYWGAVWCPPCNQVKATLFSRADFQERAKAFVAVYVDGDKPGAQKIGARFKVRGYPTMIIFKPDGTEVTRLPGEVDPERYMLTLTQGLNAQDSVQTLVKRAMAGGALSAQQWRQLAYYSWDTDEQQVVTQAERGSTLRRLAMQVSADAPEARDRLMLKALATQAQAANLAASATEDSAWLQKLLSDPARTAVLTDGLIASAETVPKALHTARTSDQVQELIAAWDAVLARTTQAQSASRGLRADAWVARASLWKQSREGLSATRVTQLRTAIDALVASSKDRFERQNLVPTAAYALSQVGLFDAADAMLQAELPQAIAPFYHMSALASNAKRAGRNDDALNWYAKAWAQSQGPATRLQWGVSYLSQLIELTPNDTTRIGQVARAIIAELPVKPETFYERNERSLRRLIERVRNWAGTSDARVAVMRQSRDELAAVCRQLPAADAGRQACEALVQ